MARPHRIQVYRAPNRRWYWRRLAGNHRVVAASEQGFRTRRYCMRDARRDLPASVVNGCGYELEVLDTAPGGFAFLPAMPPHSTQSLTNYR